MDLERELAKGPVFIWRTRRLCLALCIVQTSFATDIDIETSTSGIEMVTTGDNETSEMSDTEMIRPQHSEASDTSDTETITPRNYRTTAMSVIAEEEDDYDYDWDRESITAGLAPEEILQFSEFAEPWLSEFSLEECMYGWVYRRTWLEGRLIRRVCKEWRDLLEVSTPRCPHT
jgi:hypothetical protein